jgi:hypothetical protein
VRQIPTLGNFSISLLSAVCIGATSAGHLQTTLPNDTVVAVEYDHMSAEAALERGRKLARKMWHSVCGGKISKPCQGTNGYYKINIYIGISAFKTPYCTATLNGLKSSFIGTHSLPYIEVAHSRCSEGGSLILEDFS